jgi:hypothetical protein
MVLVLVLGDAVGVGVVLATHVWLLRAELGKHDPMPAHQPHRGDALQPVHVLNALQCLQRFDRIHG